MNIHWHFAVENALFSGASSTLAILRGILVDHVKYNRKLYISKHAWSVESELPKLGLRRIGSQEKVAWQSVRGNHNTAIWVPKPAIWSPPSVLPVTTL